MTSFDDLMALGLSAPFSGWDFSWLHDRSTTTELPWSYEEEVSRRTATATAMLDMGTGGGEWLSELVPRPSRTVATECWPPNTPIAGRRLQPLGIGLVQAAGAPDNMDTGPSGQQGAGVLPFRDGAFDVVINRHESFDAGEVARVLAPGGIFITQQVDFHSDDDMYRLLGMPAQAGPDSWLPLAERQVTGAGLTIRAAKRGEEVQHIADLAGFVYYLRAISWVIGDQSPDVFRPQLRQAFVNKALWPVALHHWRFLLAAVKPG